MPLDQQRIVVIGASAGGVEALRHIVRDLPSGFAAPVIIVLHVPPESPSLLAGILARDAKVRVKTGENGEILRPGVVYVAPPDVHLIVERDGSLRTSRGPRENRHRPAVDPLFRSAALAYGNRSIGLVLTGNLDDGTAGLMAIKQRGGVALVQDPGEAMYPGMPQSARLHVSVDACLSLNDIVPHLVRILEAPSPAAPPAQPPVRMEMESRIADFDGHSLQEDERPGIPSPFSCPDCGGVLWEIEDEELVRYRCRTGHAFGTETMLAAQEATLEEALWTALKTLEESARLSRRLARSETERGHDWMAARFDEKERDARARAEVLRKFLITGTSALPAYAVHSPAPDPEDER